MEESEVLCGRHTCGARVEQSGQRSDILAPVAPSCPPRIVPKVAEAATTVTWTRHSAAVSDMRALLVSVCFYFNHATMASIGILSRSKPILLDSDHEASVRHFCRHHWREPRVRRFCLSEPAVIHTIVHGMRTTVKHCLSLFEWERWQCDLLQDRTKLLRKVYRETAFVYALTAAGMAHSVAQGCRLGRLSRRCSCAKAADSSSGSDELVWKWAGCGDNRPFAAKFSRRLLSRPNSFRRPRTLRKPVDMHNIAVGIRVLKHGSRQVCKCHGVSGSCSVKTCWRELAPFPEVALRLKRKYETAVSPQLENKPAFAATDVVSRPRKGPPAGPTATTQRPKWLAAVTAELRRLGRDRLVFLENWPSFCEPNVMTGRRCRDQVHCDQVCCDRRHTAFTEVVIEACNCTMQWCCQLKCRTCKENRVGHVCL